MATKTTVSAKDAKILDMVFNPEGTMLPDKETENMLNSEPIGKQSRTPSTTHSSLLPLAHHHQFPHLSLSLHVQPYSESMDTNVHLVSFSSLSLTTNKTSDWARDVEEVKGPGVRGDLVGRERRYWWCHCQVLRGHHSLPELCVRLQQQVFFLSMSLCLLKGKGSEEANWEASHSYSLFFEEKLIVIVVTCLLLSNVELRRTEFKTTMRRLFRIWTRRLNMPVDKSLSSSR